MTLLQRKTGAGSKPGSLPAPVGSAHTFLNVRIDADNRVALSHCIRDAPALQSPAWDALRQRAERLMREDEARYGAHWMVWMSATYARNGWPWHEGAGAGEVRRG